MFSLRRLQKWCLPVCETIGKSGKVIIQKESEVEVIAIIGFAWRLFNLSIRHGKHINIRCFHRWWDS